MSTPHGDPMTGTAPPPSDPHDEDDYGDDKTNAATETSQVDTEDPMEPPETGGGSGS